MRRIPLIYQILIVNSVIVCLGAVAGTATTRRLANTEGVTLTVIFALIGVILSVVSNYALLRFALRPLTNLQTTAERVTEGDLSVRVPISNAGDRQISQLATTFNAMLSQVEDDTRELERSQQLTEQLTKQVINAQEDERRRIARELHDDTAQALATLVIYAHTVKQLPELAVCVRDQMQQIVTLANQTLEGVRTIIADLRPSQLDDLGLAAAIRAQATERLIANGIHADIQVTGEEQRLPSMLETAIYRIVQEAFTNVLKHAHANHVEVDLNLAQEHKVSIRIEDDGIGFDSKLIEPDRYGHSIGMFGMFERANLLGGTLHIDSAPNVGTEIRLEVPL